MTATIPGLTSARHPVRRRAFTPSLSPATEHGDTRQLLIPERPPGTGWSCSDGQRPGSRTLGAPHLQVAWLFPSQGRRNACWAPAHNCHYLRFSIFSLLSKEYQLLDIVPSIRSQSFSLIGGSSLATIPHIHSLKSNYYYLLPISWTEKARAHCSPVL